MLTIEETVVVEKILGVRMRKLDKDVSVLTNFAKD
jgi:hypothetical protein